MRPAKPLCRVGDRSSDLHWVTGGIGCSVRKDPGKLRGSRPGASDALRSLVGSCRFRKEDSFPLLDSETAELRVFSRLSGMPASGG